MQGRNMKSVPLLKNELRASTLFSQKTTSPFPAEIYFRGTIFLQAPALWGVRISAENMGLTLMPNILLRSLFTSRSRLTGRKLLNNSRRAVAFSHALLVYLKKLNNETKRFSRRVRYCKITRQTKRKRSVIFRKQGLHRRRYQGSFQRRS